MRITDGQIGIVFVAVLCLVYIGVTESLPSVPINVTIFDKTHSEIAPDEHFTQSAEAVYASTSGWLLTLQSSAPRSVIRKIMAHDTDPGCHVSRLVEMTTRLFVEIECEYDAPASDTTIPAFVAIAYRTLSMYGDVVREESAIFHNRATQPNAPWGVDRVDERDLPLDGVYTYDYTGAGVELIVVDTGIRTTHTMFGGRARNIFNALTGTVDTRPNTDCHGHGTFVASVAAGSITGTAKGASLVGVVSLDCNGRATTGMIVTALSYVEAYARVNSNKRIVVNLSFGGPYSPTIDVHAASLAAVSNVVVVVAAGNEGTNACRRSPSSTASVMTVGATDMRDGLARFTNTGRCVNITAPGVQIRGASHTSDVLTKVGSGTSFSSPLAAGVAAMVFQQTSRPGASGQVMETIYNWARVKQFFPQIISEAIYDPWKSGIDYAQDASDTISRAEASLNYPFLYSRINLASAPPHDNVDGNTPLYPPNNATRFGDMVSSLALIVTGISFVWLV